MPNSEALATVEAPPSCTAASPLNLFMREDVVQQSCTTSSLIKTLGVGPLRKGGRDLLDVPVALTVGEALWRVSRYYKRLRECEIIVPLPDEKEPG